MNLYITVAVTTCQNWHYKLEARRPRVTTTKKKSLPQRVTGKKSITNVRRTLESTPKAAEESVVAAHLLKTSPHPL